MGRNTSLPEVILEFASLLPWYIGLLLAIISYFVLHHFAAVEIPPPNGILIHQPFFNTYAGKTLASIGQFILPLAFGLGALISATRCRQREQLYAFAQGGGKNFLTGISWKEFEILVGEAFRRKGYSVRENEGAGPDGGVDLVLYEGTEKYLVQCKQWRALKVGVKVVRELYGVMASSGAVGGFVVTSGQFTREAERFAEGKNIELIGRKQLHSMVQAAKASLPTSATPSTRPQSKQCPKCGKEMEIRTAKKGPKAGQKFWGCSGYPACKSTLSIE